VDFGGLSAAVEKTARRPGGQRICEKTAWLAAGVGFEPTEPVPRLGDFQDRTKTVELQALFALFASEFASVDRSVVCRDDARGSAPDALRDRAQIALRGVEPPVPGARLTIAGRIVQTSLPRSAQMT
jgi:hypothetical protein